MLEAAQIQAMSMAERLQALEQLWDAVCREDAAVSSPAWHGDLLAERRARAARGEAKFLTLEQLKAHLRVSGS